MDNEVTLELLPVCKCGYVFKKIEIKENVFKEGEDYIYKSERYFFIPKYCPHCGKQINGLSINNDMLNRFK